MKPQKIFFTAILLFAFFPLLPNRIKGLSVIIFFLSSIYLFIRYNKEDKFNVKKVLFFSSLYLVYLVSLIYTSNFTGIDKTLTTRLSLLVIPLSFGLLSTVITKIKQKQYINFCKIYFFTSLVYSIAIIIYVLKLGYFNGNINIGETYAHIANEMWGINQHPIYASMLLSFAVFFGIKITVVEKKNIYKALAVFGLCVILCVLLFLARKGILLALFISGFTSFAFSIKRLKYKKYILGVIIILIPLLFLTPTVKKRFGEVFSEKTYSNITRDNSTSIRYGIYRCAIKKIKDSPIIGYGMGDVDDILQECYSKNSTVLADGNYNSHNQYFSFLLSNGIIGLLILLIFMYKSLAKAIKDKNTLFMAITIFYIVIMLFENILERQSGVILFAFLMCFFNFVEVEKDITFVNNKKLMKKY